MVSELTFETLTAAQMKAYLDQLRTSHRITTNFYVMDASEKGAVEISDAVIAGQIDLDATSPGSKMRSMSFSVLDPDDRVAPESNTSPALGGLWAGSCIRADYSVLVVDLNAWVLKTVFVGPVTSIRRGSQTIDVVCASKDSLLLPPNNYGNVFNKTNIERAGKSRKGALAALLKACGEAQTLDWQSPDQPLPHDFNALKTFHGKGDSFLGLADAIVGSGNVFYFDGSGRPRVRKKSSRTLIDLTGFEMTDVGVSFDLGTIANRAKTKVSHKPTTKTGTPPPSDTVVATLAPADPLSAQSLKRNDTPRYLDAAASSQTYKKRSEATKAAEAELSHDVDDAQLDIIPVPFLEPFDRVKVQGLDGRVATFTVKQFSLPLHVGDGMSLGYKAPRLDARHAVARFRKNKQKHGH